MFTEVSNPRFLINSQINYDIGTEVNIQRSLMQSGVSRGRGIEEGSIQKTRQTVVVLDWGARSNAALGIFGVKV